LAATRTSETGDTRTSWRDKKRSRVIGQNPGTLTASSTEEIGRTIIRISSFMKEVLWLGVQQSEVSQIKWCQFCIQPAYNIKVLQPKLHEWARRRQETDSFRFVETEFITTGDGNARICNFQIVLIWLTDRSRDKGYEGRNRKDTVSNSEGRRVVLTVFWRNVIWILNSKYGENERMEATSGNQILKLKKKIILR